MSNKKDKQYYFEQGQRDYALVGAKNHYAYNRWCDFVSRQSWQAQAYMDGYTYGEEIANGHHYPLAVWMRTARATRLAYCAGAGVPASYAGSSWYNIPTRHKAALAYYMVREGHAVAEPEVIQPAKAVQPKPPMTRAEAQRIYDNWTANGVIPDIDDEREVMAAMAQPEAADKHHMYMVTYDRQVGTSTYRRIVVTSAPNRDAAWHRVERSEIVPGVVLTQQHIACVDGEVIVVCGG